MTLPDLQSPQTMSRKRKLLAQLSALQSNSSIPPSDALKSPTTTPDGNSSPKSSKYFVTEKKQSSQLEADFFNQPCISLAKSFLGQILVRKLPDGRELWGRIVETEAYLGGEDEASHSKGGKQTQRNAAMFMKPGTLYVYQIYGIYFCVNVSSQGELRPKHIQWPICQLQKLSAGPSLATQPAGILVLFRCRNKDQGLEGNLCRMVLSVWMTRADASSL